MTAMNEPLSYQNPGTAPDHPPPAATDAMTVLVAEDNPVVRKGLVNFLGKWGYQPLEVENGDDAWQHLLEKPSIRMAILDWNLPGLTGMQICQRLREKSPGSYVYLLMFSARTSTEEQIAALEGGADDYLTKPVKPSLLKARLAVGQRIIRHLQSLSAKP